MKGINNQKQQKRLFSTIREDIKRLKKMASKKLGVRAKLLFLSSGVEISEVDELQNNDTLYISQGEAFYKSLGPANGQETFQMSVLRSGGMGKSALTLCFVRYHFVKDWNPCMIEILDTAGQDVRRSRLLQLMRSWFCADEFESLGGQWMMDKDGHVFVNSMDSRISLHELEPFFDLHLQIIESRRALPPIILVDNKKDVVEREPSKCQVSTEEGRRIAHSYNACLYRDERVHRSKCNGVFETFVREVRRKKVPKPKKSACFLL
ncbi:hypothetical protein PsorP6_004999 [Peronosclerospora sorghi]|uniref:Uncharacterized protein n=1 Tax=Peronosclerospora sorghi TaxID=230839 RepID=A0ACC0W4F9_9STRA|nr:hypothetical protein PsorP6_004999 [Peronosclerospora sorghi]